MGLQELLNEIRKLRVQITRQNRSELIPPRDMNRETRSFYKHALDLTYGRSVEDVQIQRGSTIYFLTLKDA